MIQKFTTCIFIIILLLSVVVVAAEAAAMDAAISGEKCDKEGSWADSKI